MFGGLKSREVSIQGINPHTQEGVLQTEKRITLGSSHDDSMKELTIGK